MALVLLKVPIDDGDTGFIEVEVDARQLGADVALVAHDLAGLVASHSLSTSFGKLMPAIDAIVTRLRQHSQAPDEISMEMGITVGGETGLIFTKGTAGASFSVTATWRKPADTSPDDE